MRRLILRAPLVLALALSSPLASAQASPAGAEKPLAESLQGPARSAYTSAKILLNNGDYGGALAKYKQAYELSKDARLLFDMAICEKSLHAYAKMESFLQQYEREAGTRIPADEKSTVDAALAAVKNLVGTVHLTVSEAGAAVAVDGETVGTTPLPQPLVMDLGSHRVAVTKAGFVSVEKTVDVAGGSDAPLAVTLVQESHGAHLVVAADTGDVVSIDDQVVGQSRYDGSLAPGAHELRVTAPDKQPYTASLDLRDGEMRTVQVTLEVQHHGGVGIWPWIVGGAVVAAGAAVGGYFLFKPSDTVTAVPAGKFGGVTAASWRL